MNAAIYLIASAGRVKIGYSRDPWKRYRQFTTGCPTPMALVFTYYCHDAHKLERRLHERFADKRGHGEWFNVRVCDVILAVSQFASEPFRNEPPPEQTPEDEDDRELVTEEELDAFFKDLNNHFAE